LIGRLITVRRPILLLVPAGKGQKGYAERAWISEQLEHLDEELARLAAALNVPVVYTGSRR
jgi:hypothetical protein